MFDLVVIDGDELVLDVVVEIVYGSGGENVFWCIIGFYDGVYVGVVYCGGDCCGQVVVVDEVNVSVCGVDVFDELFVMFVFEYDDCQFVDVMIEGFCDVVEVFGDGSVDVDVFGGCWIDNEFFYVDVWCVEQVVVFGCCEYCCCVGCFSGVEVCIFQWIDGDVDLCCIFLIDIDVELFIDEEYWCVVVFIFIDDDVFVYVEFVEFFVY